MEVGAPARRWGPAHGQGFRHEAFLYAGDDEFVAGIGGFALDAVAAREPVLVMVGPRKIDLLRDALGRDARHVRFGDMEQVGANPARIIPAWNDFVVEHAGAPRVRGVGEPIWRGRAPTELVESQHHESLLNVAFADASQMWLVCPYDTAALEPAVIDEAHCSHPVVSNDRVGRAAESTTYRSLADLVTTSLEQPLPPPPVDAPSLEFGLEELRAVRLVAFAHAARAGLDVARAEEFVVAVNEVATNSVRHGGGRGVVRCWLDPDAVVCEVFDAGRIREPLVGRRRPSTDHDGGAGLYLANQFCDLVQVRSSGNGTTVRLHMRRS